MTGVVVTNNNIVYAIGSNQSDTNLNFYPSSLALHSSDGLMNIDLISNGLPQCGSGALTITPDGMLLASTDSGIYRSLKTVSAVKSAALDPHFNLSNFPNPFSQQTEISYSLEEPARVVLSVYNVLGSRVMSVDKGLQVSGKHSIALQAGGLAEGVYTCEVVAGGKREVRMLSLQK